MGVNLQGGIAQSQLYLYAHSLLTVSFFPSSFFSSYFLIPPHMLDQTRLCLLLPGCTYLAGRGCTGWDNPTQLYLYAHFLLTVSFFALLFFRIFFSAVACTTKRDCAWCCRATRTLLEPRQNVFGGVGYCCESSEMGAFKS